MEIEDLIGKDFFEDRSKLNLWDKISLWWTFDGKYYHKFLKHGIKNIIYWFPIIWKDRNWDHDYIFRLLQHKLKAQSKYIGSNNRHTRAQYDAQRMNICVNLMQKLQDSFYDLEYMDYAKERHWFEPCKDREGYSTWESKTLYENFDVYFKKYPLVYKKVMKGEGPFTLDGKDEDDLKKVIAMNIAHLNQDRARKLLFKIMEENIEKWWD